MVEIDYEAFANNPDAVTQDVLDAYARQQAVNKNDLDLDEIGEAQSERISGTNIVDQDYGYKNVSMSEYRDLVYAKNDCSFSTMQGCLFFSCTVEDNSFGETDLRHSAFVNSTITAFRANNSWMINVKFWNSKVRHIEMNKVSALRLDIRSSTFEMVEMRRADLAGAEVRDSQLLRANMAAASAQMAYLTETTIDLADLSDVKLDSAKIYQCHFKAVNCTNATATKSEWSEGKLEQVKFTNADLDHAVFFSMEMDEVSFQGANLGGARFEGCTFSETVDFTDAHRHLDDPGIPGWSVVNGRMVRSTKKQRLQWLKKRKTLPPREADGNP